jgi:hypothetical protein
VVSGFSRTAAISIDPSRGNNGGSGLSMLATAQLRDLRAAVACARRFTAERVSRESEVAGRRNSSALRVALPSVARAAGGYSVRNAASGSAWATRRAGT